MSDRYRAKIITSIAEMVDLAKPWNDLLENSKSRTMFLTWDWLYSWAECYLEPNRRLHIVLIYDGSELIGVAPWCIRYITYCGLTIKRIEFLGLPEASSDYLDIVARKGKEKAVADNLYEFLVKSTDLWDSIELQGISSDSLFLLHFMNRAEKDGKSLQCHLGPYCPSASLSQSVETFRARLSSNRRQQYARHLRLLQRDGDVQHCTYRRTDAQAHLDRFWPIYEQRWGPSHQLLRFVKILLVRSAGDVSPELDLLTVDGRPIAGLLHFRYHTTLSMYLMGVDHGFDKGVSVGNILVGLSIERALKEGCRIYDFLRGDEPYKFHWSNQGRRMVTMRWYGRKPAPMLHMLTEYAKSFVKVLVR